MAFEDFTTYIETDPNNRFSVAANAITVTALSRDEDAWLIKDRGAGHFSGDFEHLFKYTPATNTNRAHADLLSLANIVDDVNGIDTAAGDLLGVWYFKSDSGVNQYGLYEIVAGTPYQVDTSVTNHSVVRYPKFKRDEGVGTYGTLYLYIYSDEARTILIQTISLTLHEKEDFRYNYIMHSYDDNNAAYTLGGVLENL